MANTKQTKLRSSLVSMLTSLTFLCVFLIGEEPKSCAAAFAPPKAFVSTAHPYPKAPTAAAAAASPTSSSFVVLSLFSKKDEMSLEDEVEQLVQEEISKTKRMSNLRNEKGVEYAPWMRITAEDEARIRKNVIQKAEARRQRKESEANVQGALLMDSQAQELSGTGLRYKILSGNDVELEWATSSETNTRGFIVKRRPAKTSDFEVLASYQSYSPLASQGVDGGVYRFLDENLAPGGYVYRITECEASGGENDLSQCLVDIQTAEEQRGVVVAAVLLGVVAVAAVVAGNLLDPVQY